MYKNILFVIGLLAILSGMPYLLGYSSNECLKYPLYVGLIIAVLFAPKPHLKNVFKKK